MTIFILVPSTPLRMRGNWSVSADGAGAADDQLLGQQVLELGDAGAVSRRRRR